MEHPNRPKDGYCWKCGGGYQTLGMNSRWVPHAPDCPRNPLREPQSEAEQDREREALTDRYAPVSAPEDPFTSPWADDEDTRRRILGEGLPLAPKREAQEQATRTVASPEPPSLVEQSDKQGELYLGGGA